MLVLCATLLVEMPVLLVTTGRSEALCSLIGRRRFYLLIGMILLNNAISGNVGLQASSLTTRAISHSHVTVGSYKRWFVSEVGAAAYIGLGMGCLLGSIALVASEMDFAFAFTIMIAQFISIVTAGITGTFAPLLFSFVFKRDSGKWGGPLETAFQDIVGTFAMVVVSYYLLALFGAGNIDPSDSCATVS
jgi:Mg/Co/Ni transporter MgtE